MKLVKNTPRKSMARAVAASTRNGQSRRRGYIPYPLRPHDRARDLHGLHFTLTRLWHCSTRFPGSLKRIPALGFWVAWGISSPTRTRVSLRPCCHRRPLHRPAVPADLFVGGDGIQPEGVPVLWRLSLPHDPPLWASGTPLRPVPGPSDRQRCPRRRRRPRLRQPCNMARSPQCHRSGISRVFSKLRAILGRVSVSCKAKARS